MNKKSKLYKVHLPVFLMLLPILVILRTVACLNYLDEFGYFTNDILITVSDSILAAAIVFYLFYIIIADKEMRFIPSFDSAASYIPSALVGAALAFIFVELMSFFVNSDSASVALTTRVTAILGAILAIGAIAYFAISSILVARRSIKRSDYALFVLLFACVYTAFIYFDTTLPINSPTKTVNILAYLSVALFFLYEARLSLGREKWRQYIAFGFICATLCAYSSIPSLIYYFVKGEPLALSIYESILTLSLFIFAALKLILVSFLTGDEPSQVALKIKEAADARTLALTPEAKDEVPVLTSELEPVEDVQDEIPLDDQETFFTTSEQTENDEQTETEQP